MWFMNHIARPLVAAVLRSPLHGLLSRSVLLVTYRGRRTGREITLPVQYARDGDDYLVTVGAPGAKVWWRNFTDGLDAALLVKRSPVACQGRVEVDEGETRVRFHPGPDGG